VQNLFVFDPNTVSMEQLQQLGFREKTATTLLKFRSRGFVFKEKKDLQKVYGISDKFYARLVPYIVIKETAAPHLQMMQEKTQAPAQPAKTIEPAKIELNSADSSALVSLNGIGPAYARRILKYRSILGGFITAEQLKEVYGFTEELYDKVKPSVTVDAGLVRRIRINTDDFKTLNKHPYLSYELTKSICNSRRQGAVTTESLKDLLKDDALYRRLSPYLTFD
jgi:competence ComEA-like helix-hairpin-helix protein